MSTALNIQFNIESTHGGNYGFCHDSMIFLLHDTVIFLIWLSGCGAQQSSNILRCNILQPWDWNSIFTQIGSLCCESL